MAAFALLLCAALATRGELKANLDVATYPVDAGRVTVELSYEIPYTSLSFVRDDSAYRARVRLAVEVVERSGQPLLSEVRLREVSVSDYGATAARDSAVAGTLGLTVPAAATLGRIRITDPASEREAHASFRIERPSGGMALRIARPAGQLVFGKEDTLQATAEASGLDSCEFSVIADRRRLLGTTVAAFESAGRRIARYRLPLADSSGRAVLSSGDYLLEARRGQARARAGFAVKVSFLDDDRAYARRVDQLVYVASYEQMRRLRAVAPAARDSAWRGFWRTLDQTPTTDRNEREEEYFERIDHAEEQFGHGDRGYRSDRGHVYVVYGSPDQVEQRPFELNAPAVEIWYYYSMGKTFTFYDRFGSGQMVLANPEALDGR
jgi:GWxTD domain-containing protein